VDQLKNGNGCTGITEFAQKELGDIVYIEIETIGKSLAAETIRTVEAVKTVSDFTCRRRHGYRKTPNLQPPELVNSDLGDGWMIKLTVDDQEDIDKLMDASSYSTLVH
jgi:glycine cleavage system H protein